MRIGITLNESFLTSAAVWTEGQQFYPTAFKKDNPGHGPGLVNLWTLRGSVELIPLSGDDHVSAYALYDWSKPDARLIVLDPPGATFQCARNGMIPLLGTRIRRSPNGSVLRIATILSRRFALENQRLLTPTLDRFRREGVANGSESTEDYAWEQLRKLPEYSKGSKVHVYRLNPQQLSILVQNEALTPFFDLHDKTTRDKLKPDLAAAIDELPSTDSVVVGIALRDWGPLVDFSPIYVRRGDTSFEIRLE